MLNIGVTGAALRGAAERVETAADAHRVLTQQLAGAAASAADQHAALVADLRHLVAALAALTGLVGFGLLLLAATGGRRPCEHTG